MVATPCPTAAGLAEAYTINSAPMMLVVYCLLLLSCGYAWIHLSLYFHREAMRVKLENEGGGNWREGLGRELNKWIF